MKNFLLLIGLLLLFPFYIASQQFDIQQVGAAVRPVTLSIRFSEDIITLSHIYLFRMLEKEMGRPIVDQYLSLSSGSGFFISEEGHLITNHHVIDVNSVGQNLRRYMNSYLNTVDKEYGYLFSKAEFAEFAEVIKRIFVEGDIDRLVLLDDGKEYKLEILNTDISRDLALLKLVTPQKTTPLYFVRTADLDAIRDVYSIGFPLPDLLNRFFEDINSTVTSGIVSARREKNLDTIPNNKIKTLQHTASINMGSSGGPLVTDTGLVVGVNSSLLTDANNIYFAVSTEEVALWLGESNLSSLLQTKRLSSWSRGSVTDSDSDLGEADLQLRRIDVIFTSQPDGAKVFVGDEFIGSTPFTTNLVGPREYEVTITKEGHIEIQNDIFITDEDDLTFDFSLQAGGEVVFDRELPPTLKVVAEKDGESYTFGFNEQVILPNGEWTVSLDGPISNRTTRQVTIASSQANLDPAVFMKPMNLHLFGVSPESEVMLLPSKEVLSLDKEALVLPYGGSELLVQTPDYRDYIFSVEPDYQETDFIINVEYHKRNEVIYKRNIGWGLATLIGGVVVTGASIALNLENSLLVSISDSYETYAFLKYLTFGTMLAGDAAIGLGLWGTIKAVAHRNRSDEPILREYDYAE